MEPRHGSPRRSALRALPCTELGADRCACRGSMTRSGPSPVPPPPSTPTPRPCPHIDGSSAAAKVTSGATRRPGAVGKSGRRCGGGPTVPHHLSPREGKGRRLSVFEHGHAASIELPPAPAPSLASHCRRDRSEEPRRKLVTSLAPRIILVPEGTSMSARPSRYLFIFCSENEHTINHAND